MARRSIENLEKRELMTAASLVDDSTSALNSEEFHNSAFIDMLSHLGGDDQFGFAVTVNQLGGHKPFVIGGVGNDELTKLLPMLFPFAAADGE